MDESAHRLGRNVVITTQTHALVIEPATGKVLRAMPFGSHGQRSWGLPDGRIAAPMLNVKQTRVLDPRTGRQWIRRGRSWGSTTPAASSSRPSSRQMARSRRTSSSVMPNGDRSQEQRVDGHVAEVVFLPGGRELAVARDEVIDVHDARTLSFLRTLEGHSGVVLGIELGGPARGLLWTAGRDGTAVAFDLTGTRGVLRTVDLDVAAGFGSAAVDRAVLTQRYDTDFNTARIIDLAEGRDLFGELQPFTDCACQIGNTAITPDGRFALAGVTEWTDDFSEAITDRGRVVMWDTDTGELTRTIDVPWEPDGLAVTPDGERLLVNGSGGWALYDLSSGEELWSHETDVAQGYLVGLPLAGAAPDGSRLVVLRSETVIVLDPASGEEVVSQELPDAAALTRVAFSADSRTMALGSVSGRLYFLDVATLERVAPDRLVTAGFVTDLQLSPDGSILAAMGSDGDVTLFDPPRGGPSASRSSTGSARGSCRSPRTACGSTARPEPTTSSPRTPPNGQPPDVGSPTPSSRPRSQP